MFFTIYGLKTKKLNSEYRFDMPSANGFNKTKAKILSSVANQKLGNIKEKDRIFLRMNGECES